jgi:hypothetical protein
MPATAFLGVAAPVGGTTLTFTSSDPTRILLAKDLTSAGASQISIPVAQGGTSTNFVIMGLENVTGNPTVTIQAPGYTDGTASVSVQPIGVQYSIAGGAFTTLSPDMGGTLSIGVLTGVDGNRFMALVQPIRFGGVSRTVTMTSSNPAVILPVAGGVATQSATVTLQPGEGSVSVPIRPIGAGTAIISPSGVGLLLADAPNNPPSVTVTTPTQTLSISTFSQGAGLAQTATLFLGAAVPAGGRTLTLTSTNPSRLLLAPNATTAASNQLTFNLTQGATSLGVVFVGLEGVTGSAPVTASISGYRDTTFTFTVVQPAVVLDGPAATRTVTQGDVGFAAQVGVLVGGSIQVQTVRFDAPAPLTVTLTSSAPSIGTVVVGGTAGSPNSIEILPGNSSSAFNGAMFRPLSSGNTTISASIPGFIQHGNAIRTVTVTP